MSSKSDLQTFQQARREANAGQPAAQYKLGLMYANGVGTPQDPEQAIYWYRQAAEQGHAAAQYILASKYASGQGVERSMRQAMSWYMKASDRGNARALFKLAKLLSVPQEEFADECFRLAAEKGEPEAQVVIASKLAETADPSGKGQQAAAGWYQKAADSGSPSAQHALAVSYEHGRGVPRDLQQAVAWYRKAARQGFAAAQTRLGRMYASGEGVAKDNRQAVSWFARAADQGDAEAQYQLGLMHEQGLGTPSDAEQAERCYLKAAEQGDVRAQLRLARLYEADVESAGLAVYWYGLAADRGSVEAMLKAGRMHGEGRGTPQNFDRALALLLAATGRGDAAAAIALAELVEREGVRMSSAWYLLAAGRESPEAQYRIGSRLAQGQGVAQDARAAEGWYRKAAEQGLPEAEFALAEVALATAGPAQLAEAVEYCRKAARQGYAPAQTLLGKLYAQGRGVPRDIRQAASWWLKAAEQGDGEAQYVLGQVFDQGLGGDTGKKHARQWYRRAIERADDSRAILALADLLAPDDAAAAEPLYREAAARNNARAQAQLARLLYRQAGGEIGPDSLSFCLQAAGQGDRQALAMLAELIRQQPEDSAALCERLAGAMPDHPATRPRKAIPAPAGTSLAPPADAYEQQLALAQGGDPRAQWVVAGMLARGTHGQAQDVARARDFYQQAAQAGFVAAQAALALLYSTGQGGVQDSSQAVYWWTQAAEQGDAESQYNVSLMFEKGQGVAADPEVAMQWLRKAAEQGVVMAQTRLGLAYAMGRGGPPDLAEAYAWFAVAAMSGNEAALANREHAEGVMSAAELREGRRRAETLLRLLGQEKLLPRGRKGEKH